MIFAILATITLTSSPRTAHAQLFVVDFGINGNSTNSAAIGEYTVNNGNAEAVDTSLIPNLGNAKEIAISGSDIFVLVSGGTDGSVGEYDIYGDIINPKLITGLADPFAIAASGTNLYITTNNEGSVGSATVAKYGTDGTLVNAALVSGFTDGSGIAISGTQMFVADSYAGVIAEYSTSGDNVNPLLVQEINELGGIAISGTTLYVTTGDSSIAAYDTSGNLENGALILNANAEHVIVSGTTLFTSGDNTGIVAEWDLSGNPINQILLQNLEGPLGIAVISATPAPAQGITVTVPGTANPYLAGQADGSTAADGDSAPAESPVQVQGLSLTTGMALSFSATGSVSYFSEPSGDTPDGSGTGSHGIENGISGFSAPWNALVGVFLDDSDPTTSDAPGTLDFFDNSSVTGGTDYTSVSPQLKQVFFIGDGQTSGGITQQVVVPAGATRLYLGTTDGSGWYDNTGSLSVLVTTGTAPARTVTFSATGPSADGAAIHFTATTLTGYSVRVQATTTPDIEGSWTDLADGGMTEDTQNPGTYAVNSAAYPNGSGIYFRAIAAHSGDVDIISAGLGAFTLKQAVLSISVSLASTSDPAQGTVTHIGDSLTFQFAVINSGSATARSLQVTAAVPDYIQNLTNVKKQFVQSDITTISSSGTFFAAGANPARVIWGAGDLDAGSQLVETFTIHISTDVREEQSLQMGNDYSVFSTTGQPPVAATGFTSGSPNLDTHIRGPISFTLTPLSTTVAPGGLITYKGILTNLGSSVVTKPIAVITLPQFTRFDTSYPTGAKTSINSFINQSALATATCKETYWTGSPIPRIVITFPALAAASDSKHRNIYTFELSIQAQWANPSEVAEISTTDYAAGFLDPTTFVDTLTGKKTSELSVYSSDLSGATNPDNPGDTDFVSLITDGTHEIAYTDSDGGEEDVTFTGSVTNQPSLFLLKAISDPITSTQDPGDGDGVTDFVQPGDEITFVLGVSNFGKSPADDISIEDGMPDHSTFISAKLLDKDSKKQSVLDTVQDLDHQHLQFKGLHLEANDNLSVEYTVKVDSGAAAPALNTFIDADDSSVGSTSTPHTPFGLYINGPIQISGSVAFAQPVVRAMIGNPGVSGTDISLTANALTAIYNKTPSALPLTNASDPLSYIPGDERFYIHYANVGKVAATKVRLEYPLPIGTAFYRASFVKLTANQATGALGYLPGKLVNTPTGSSIIPPAGPANGFLSSGGSAVFTFNKLAPGDAGDVMVEAIVTPDAIHDDGHYIGNANSKVTIHDSTVTDAKINAAIVTPDSPLTLVGNQHESQLYLGEIAVNSLLLAPNPAVGIWKNIPRGVKPGDNFTVQLIVSNYSDVDAHDVVQFTVPENTEFVSLDCGQSFVPAPPVGSGPGTSFSGVLASGNGVVTTNDLTPLLAHTAGVLTITLKATGAINSTIMDNSAKVSIDGVGTFNAGATSTDITNTPTIGEINVVAGAPLLQATVNNADVLLIDLGGGNIVAQGGGNIVAQGGGNIVAQGGGNIVAQGGGNLIGIGSTTAASLLANQSSIVAQGGGNLIVPGGNTIVAQGGGNIVAAGGGNIVAQGGGNIVAQGGGNIVAQGGGNIVAQGGGNIVAQGGGNIVAAGGGNIVAQGGGNIVGSTPGSIAGVITSGGNIISAGGGGSFAPNGP